MGLTAEALSIAERERAELEAMARAQGVSKATVQRIWSADGLQPHRTRSFKVSRDPQFVEKLTDVVGLYVNPPDKALVSCVDEKSQIQALQRIQPGLPLKKGRCGTMTHDYKRHGTAPGQCQGRHRHQEFLHLILDNHDTHKHPKVCEWLAKRPRFQLHLTPTSSSWLNLVERWFRELTDKRLRRGVFHSVDELIADIEQHNQELKPFVWTVSVERILRKAAKCKTILETLH